MELLTERAETRASLRHEDILTLLGGIWLVLGLFIDGYAHAEVLDTETEDFFTPWHAIFYSGFAFTVSVVGLIAYRRVRPGPVSAWLPSGYGLTAVGIGIFAVGGGGDAIWHTLFGVEVGIDALLSPTHLLLFVGMALILTTPVRVAWLDSELRDGWKTLARPIVSTAIATALVVFFFSYAYGLGQIDDHQVLFDPVTEAGEGQVQRALASSYVATMLLAVPVLALLRRWDLPRGAIAVVWTVPVLLEALAFGSEEISVAAAILGGFTAELAIDVFRRRMRRGTAIVGGTTIGIMTLWAVWIALIHVTEGVRWIPELWTGQIVSCGLIAIALGLLAFTPTPTAPAD